MGFARGLWCSEKIESQVLRTIYVDSSYAPVSKAIKGTAASIMIKNVHTNKTTSLR